MLLKVVNYAGNSAGRKNTKTESNNSFILHCFNKNNDKHAVEEANRRDMFCFAECKMPLNTRELDIALENHVLCAQPKDYSLICLR